ncbi:MAG: bifunctional [glutamine synthetase] adenylyltransferase/[glutamine synthetase]-adenylyl-L-tyrosine phosphorylase, partial [Pseudomonadota bacterium]
MTDGPKLAGFAERITRCPLILRGTHDFEDDDGFRRLIVASASASPYLARLISRYGDWLDTLRDRAPEDVLSDQIADLRRDIAATDGQTNAMKRLREAKARSSLLIGLADLGGVWTLEDVTGALSDLADAAVDVTVDFLLRDELRRGRLPGLSEDNLEDGAGYVVLAMGKHGARELNYSSDIDLICLFDQGRFEVDDFADAKARYIRLTRGLVKMLSETTENGYVFRTDLRLRPSPSTTPVCIALEAAERYYESVGRTWERAAHIKARPIAGDIDAGREYLDRLKPFVWRRYLDFAAVEDTHDMLRKIRETKGSFHRAEIAGTDIKVSPGGIREIEFFAQTRQLIQGGRNAALRDPTTRGALEALSAAGIVPVEMTQELYKDYVAHRTLEHRLQIVEDARTHTIPTSRDGRVRVAALMGYSDLALWETEIATRLSRVHARAESFFAPATDQAEARDSLSGIDAQDLDRLGFQRPEDTLRLIMRWRTGGISATRSERSRTMYAGLEPRILRILAGSGDPDQAAIECDRFLSGLPAGVQVFSLFASNPHLLELIIGICAVAPKLAAHLGRNPQTLDALLDQSFFDRVPCFEDLLDDLEARLGDETDYERVLDGVRRWAREIRFRVGVQILDGMADAEEAGNAFSAIAEASIRALSPRVTAEFAMKHGPPPGRGIAVIAMGKLGSSEMTAGSDLDLIMIYDPADEEMSTGRKPLAPQSYYTRLTQALLAAITAPTTEGQLYDVDMRLRPSGRKGPVAVSLQSFSRYQMSDAWVWEHMALTRARVITGDRDLVGDIEAVIRKALNARREQPAVMTEAREMRQRIADARTASSMEAWSLKDAPGGLMEIEFLVQTGVLQSGVSIGPRALDNLPALA